MHATLDVVSGSIHGKFDESHIRKKHSLSEVSLVLSLIAIQALVNFESRKVVLDIRDGRSDLMIQIILVPGNLRLSS